MNELISKAVECYNKSDYPGAINFFRQAAITSGNHLMWYNLGVCYQETQQYEQALAAFQKSTAINPLHADSLNNTGFALYELGRGPEAFEFLEKAFHLSPESKVIAPNYIAVRCAYSPMEEWADICTKVLKHPKSPATNQYLAGVYLACIEWGLHQQEKAFKAASHPPQENFRWTREMWNYEQFIAHLMSAKNKDLYKPGAAVSMIGDSHVFSYAGLEFHGKRIAPQLIVGAKAFHIFSPRPKYLEALKSHMARLPDGSRLICSFGEIDCRSDEGIMSYHRKSGRPLQDIVTEQVASYVSTMNRLAAPKNLELVFVNIPAPHSGTGDRREVVKLFNEHLCRHTNSIIDAYAVSAGSDGYAVEGRHIDDIHLKPDTANTALAQYKS